MRHAKKEGPAHDPPLRKMFLLEVENDPGG